MGFCGDIPAEAIGLPLRHRTGDWAVVGALFTCLFFSCSLEIVKVKPVLQITNMLKKEIIDARF